MTIPFHSHYHTMTYSQIQISDYCDFPDTTHLSPQYFIFILQKTAKNGNVYCNYYSMQHIKNEVHHERKTQ